VVDAKLALQRVRARALELALGTDIEKKTW